MSPTNCDGCGEREAVFMVTEIPTGDTNAWCPFCFITSAESLGKMLVESGVIEAPPEAGPKRRRPKPQPEHTDTGESVEPGADAQPDAGTAGEDQPATEATAPAAVES